LVGLISPTHKTETNVRNFGQKPKTWSMRYHPSSRLGAGSPLVGLMSPTHTRWKQMCATWSVWYHPKPNSWGLGRRRVVAADRGPVHGDVSSLPMPSSSASAGLSRSTSWARRSMRAPTPRLMATCGGRSRVAAPPGERLGEAGAARPVPPPSPCLRRRRVRAVHDCSRGHQGRLRGGRLRPRVQNRQVLWRAARGPRHAQVQFFPRIAAKEVWGDL